MRPSRRLAVLIGINHGGHDLHLPALRYAESDAQSLHRVLLDQEIGTFDDGDVDLFIGGGATSGTIKTRLRELALDASPSDVLLVYFAGHAFVPEWSTQPDAYLVTADFEPNALRREPDSGLRMTFLKRDVFEAFAGTSFLILDCCHAGTYVDAETRHEEAMQTYRPLVNRHSALLACRSGSAARESDEFQHGVLTHHVLRALRGEASDGSNRVSFGQMVAFVDRQEIQPSPVQFAQTWGPTSVLTQRPVPRHDRQSLSKPAVAGTTRPCRNPLDSVSSSIKQLLGRLFRPEVGRAEQPPRPDHEERVEAIRYALDAESVAVVDFSRSSIHQVNATPRFDKDKLRSLLELSAADTTSGRGWSPGHVVSNGTAPHILCVPLSREGDRRLTLIVVDPPLAVLEMGEPLAVMLHAIWASDPIGDPLQSELQVLTALRTTFGRLPLELYEYAFTLYQKLVDSMVMVFQPVVELSQRWSGVGIHSYEALARRGRQESRAPWAALQLAHAWGDRFIVERDGRLLSKAIQGYAAADAESPWDGTKPLSINVAVRSLLSDSYSAQVRGAVRDAHLNPRTVTLEISEQDAIEPGPDERWTQEPLVYFHSRLASLARDLRISFAVDDFGVGYSSLARMAELPLTQIKVDRAILHHPLAVEELELVTRIARYASDLGHAPTARAVVVEGFDGEAPVTLKQLYELGIHHVQGYFFGTAASTSLLPLDDPFRERIAELVRGEDA